VAWKIFALLNVLLGLCELLLIGFGDVKITAWLVITDIFSVLGTFFVVLYAFGFSLFSKTIRSGFAAALALFVIAETAYLSNGVYDAHMTAEVSRIIAAWVNLLFSSGLSLPTLIAVLRYSRGEFAQATPASGI